MANKGTLKKIVRILFRTLAVILFVLVVSILALAIAIQSPAVQTHVVKKAAAYLSEKTGADVTVGSLAIRPFRKVRLKEVYISDLQKDTLLAIGHLDARLSMFDPFAGKYHFDKLELYDVNANIYRKSAQDSFNFYFLQELFAGNPDKVKKKKNPIELSVKVVEAKNINFSWDDQKTSQYYYGRFDRLLVDVDKFDLKSKTFFVDRITLEKPVFNLRMYSKKKKEKKPKKDASIDLGFNIKLKHFDLVDGSFAMKLKENLEPTTLPLQPMDLSVNDIEVHLKDARWDSAAAADIQMISARIGDKIFLKELSGKGYADGQQTYINDLKVLYNESVIKADAKLLYSSLNDYREFQDAVYWEGKLKEVNIKKKDVAIWLPKNAQKYLTDVQLKGNVKGTFDNIIIEKMQINAGQQTVIAGKASVKGLPKIDQMLLDVQLDQFSTNTAEIKRIAPYLKLPPQLSKLGTISFKGAFFGFVNDFVAYGKLRTAVGDVTSDIKISIDKKTKTPYYKGSFAGSNVRIGELINNTKLIGDANFDLVLDGKGFKIEELSSNIDGTINSLELKGYNYKDIRLQGKIDKKLFTGTVNIDDDCIFLNFDGTVDFNHRIPVYKAQTVIRHADLMGLNLINEKLIVSLDGFVDLQGKTLNDLNGQVDLAEISLENNNATIYLSDTRFSFLADSLTGYKDYNVASDEISAWIRGTFDPVKVGAQVQNFLSNYSAYVPRKKSAEFIHQDFMAHFEMASDFGIVKFFVPKFERFHSLYLNTSFDNTENDFTIDISSDSIVYDNMSAYNLSIDGGLSGKNLIVFTQTDSLVINGKKKSQTIPIIQAGISSSLDTLMVDLGVADDSARNSIRLQTLVDTEGDSTTFKVLASRLRVNDKDWTVSKGNSLVLYDSLFIANNFALEQDDQTIRILNGKTSFSDARVEITNFNLADVGQLLPNDTLLSSGRLFGNITLLNPLKHLEAEVDLRVTGLDIFGYSVDELLVKGTYVDSSKVITASGSLDGSENKLTFDGHYDINGEKTNSINVDADIEKASLNFLQILLKKDISNTSAFIKGKVNFSGSIKEPRLEGKANIIDTARTTVNFLGANFRFANNEEIIIRPTEFDFGDITLYDPDGNKAQLSGKLKHNFFKAWELDIEINTNKFQLMNTTAKDNADYYGTAYAKADISMNGLVQNLNIDITARTLPNTVFSIPLSKLSNTGTYNYIQFKSRSDTSTNILTQYKPNLKGVNLNFDLEVTRDALLQLIFNPATNDMIKARGHGDLELDISAAGDFNIFGGLIIDEGQYLFTFQNILNKKFEIKKGSSITWTGDPMNALLNVDAIYKTKVRLDALADTSSNISSRTIPIDLELKMTGNLSNTEINFDIIPSGLDFASQSDDLNALLNQLRDDKNLMNTQVFGILLFNRFLPTGNTGASGNLGAEFAGNTVTELLSTQLSMYLNDAISQFVKNVELDFNLRSGSINNGSDGEANGLSTELDLGFKTKLFNDRVIVNIGGTFDFNQENQTNTQQGNTGIAGDFVVEYLLTPDGRIRLKAFHRTSEYDIFGEQRSRTGASLYYQKDFDQFKELFQRENKGKKKAKKEAL